MENYEVENTETSRILSSTPLRIAFFAIIGSTLGIVTYSIFPGGIMTILSILVLIFAIIYFYFTCAKGIQ